MEFLGNIEEYSIFMYLYEEQIKNNKTYGISFQKISFEESLNLYRSMLRIQMVEEEIIKEYPKEEMKTPVHLCIGEEAVASGICEALHPEDAIFMNYRSHGPYLAKGGDLKSMIAELYSRETGCCKGYGGSMHLMDLKAHIMGSSAIVGGMIPWATGMALSNKMKGENKVTVSFLGDSATEEGVFFESLNFASLKQLPILYVCTNNFYSIFSPLYARIKGKIADRARSFSMPSYCLDGTEVEELYSMTKEIASLIREGKGPVFLEVLAYRSMQHVGPEEDDSLGYRHQKEILSWREQYPVKKQEKKLLSKGILNAEKIKSFKKEIQEEIQLAFKWAKESPLSQDQLLKAVYV